MEDNLWPKIGQIPDIDTPKKILKEQGIFLEKATANFLKVGIISYIEENRMNTFPSLNDKIFSHKFEIIAPFLNNYSFTLLKITHTISLYPLTVDFVLESELYESIKNEEELKKVLKKIFSDDKTQEVIRNLLVLNKDTTEEKYYKV